MEPVLHLGAHRTGSTALERLLRRNAGLLADAGLVLWPQSRLRKQMGYGGVAGLTRQGASDAAARAELAATTQAFAAAWAAERAAGTRRLLLSEENMLGTMNASLTRRSFYGQAAGRLRAYAAFLPEAPCRIGIGLRSYASYWRSCYLYSLPRHPLPAFDDLAADLAATARGWRALVADIAAAFPQAELLVWTQEDLQTGLAEIACRLTGLAAGPGAFKPLGRRINAAPQAGDVALIHALRRQTPGLAGRALKEALAPLRDPDAPEPRFFTPEQEARMAARYAEDLAAFDAGYAGARRIGRASGADDAARPPARRARAGMRR